jgi:DNA-binding PadR family transcriptional regulator
MYEILEHFAYEGKLSKSIVEDRFKEHRHITKTNRHRSHRRPEILAAFAFLENEGLIEEINTDPGPGLVYGRGRPKTYYAMTEKGLKELLYYTNFDPLRFWEILHEYYFQNVDRIATYDKIEEFYQIARRRHLKDSVHPFFSQLEIFDHLCDNWFQETIVESNGISPLQKVIEILALYPKITLEKLHREIDEPKELVEEVLRSYSLRLSFNFKGYADFLIRSIIVKQFTNDAEPVYELSLFGVMLCLVMIHYNDTYRLKGGLYCATSFEKYYDRIALNYREKLPLIFGKWNQLKEILGLFAYYTFDIIFDRKIRSNTKDLPSVRKGGNKQLIEGIREIILDNSDSMSKFLGEGRRVLGKYINMKFLPKAINRPAFSVVWLCAKFKELSMLLDPTPSIYRTPDIDMMDFNRGTSAFLKDIEKSFVDEITAFYYMNLYNNCIRVSEPRKYYHSKSFKPLDKTPRQCLSLLVEQDIEIRERLCKWRDDLTRLQSEVQDNIKVIV